LTESGLLEEGVEYDPYSGATLQADIVGLLQEGQPIAS
jgi:hypothetical protein